MREALERELFDAVPKDPIRIGRYSVVEPLGSGAMGFVYLAHDPDLDRKVAAKVLKKSLSASAAERMFREGRTLARLSHPNVVTIYEVGRVGDQVFVAMEYVEGGTLRDWMEAHPCTDAASVRATLEIFVQAGEGLAGAHASGVVHRDFKPDNVLVSREGEVRVADFGLASPPGPDTDTTLSSGAGLALGDSDGRLTRTGEVVGTPAYMAPEQMGGSSTDARSDQYSFCVSLYEALCGRRPYAARTFAELQQALVEGAPPLALSGGVPRWVSRVVLRGLQTEPNDRFPSMEELLAALRDDPRRRRRSMLLATGGLALVAGTAAVAYASGRGESVSALAVAGPCAGVEVGLEGWWDDSVHGAVREGLSGIDVPWAERNAALTLHHLEDYVARWVAGRKDNCEATRVRSEQSAAMFDQREACYRRAAAGVSAAAALFVDPDAGTVRNSIGVVSGLPSLAACADLERLAGLPAIDPADAVEVEAIRAESASIDAVLDAGKGHEVFERVDALFERAQRVTYPPVLAELRLLHSEVLADQGKYEDAAKTYEAAFEQALRAKHDAVLAGAAVGAFDNWGPVMMRTDVADAWQDRARAAVDRLGTDSRHAWALASLQSEYACRTQRPGCVELAERALERFDASAEKPPSTRVTLQGRLATSLSIAGQLERSLALEEEVLVATKAAYGAHHPGTAIAASNLAVSLQMRGAFERARQLLEPAIIDLEATYPEGHDGLGNALATMALVEMKLGAFVSAEEYAQRAQTMFARVLGPEHRLVASAVRIRARIALASRAFEAAVALCDEGIARHEKIGTKFFPDEHSHRAEALLQLGRFAEARAALERAIEDERALEPESIWISAHQERFARLELRRGDLRAAQTWADKALQTRARQPQPDPDAHRIHATRAAIAVATGDAPTAQKHYALSLASAQSAKPPNPVDLARARLGLAQLARDRGDDEEAARWIDEGLEDVADRSGEAALLRSQLLALQAD